jgi:hypothetical protein
MTTYDPCPVIRIDGSPWFNLLVPAFGQSVAQAIADQYERDVLAQLNLLTGSGRWTAQAVFAQILAAGTQHAKNIKISPYTLADAQRLGPFGSFTHAADLGSVPVTQGGTGGGSDAEIHYSPEILTQDSPARALANANADPKAKKWGPYATDPDDVLLHELIHAMRDLQGLNEGIQTTGPDAKYDDDEEFLAILISNIAVTEKDPYADLRRDHFGSTKLPDEEATSEGFLSNTDQTDNLFWVEFLAAEEWALFNLIAASPFAAFNPIREYITHPEKYQNQGPVDPNQPWAVA